MIATPDNTTRLSDEFVDFFHELCDSSEAPCLSSFRTATSITNKAEEIFDPVTVADRDAEQAMRELITSRYSEHGIIGEEFGVTNPDGEYQWVLDPIDGTRNFIIGLPNWGTLVGLMHNGVPIGGMLNQPYTQERYWSDGQVARHRDKTGVTVLQTRKDVTELSDAIIAASAPTYDPSMFVEDGEPEKFHALATGCKLSRYGGDCHNYARLAAGQIDLVVEATLAPYDIVALIPLIKAAGGVVTTWTGEPATNGGAIVAAANPALHEKALKILSA